MSITRRGFLGGMTVGAGALVGAGSARAGGIRQFTGYAGSRGLLHDTTLCVGCRSCEEACTKVNSLPAPKIPIGNTKIFDKVRRTTDKLYTVVNRYRKARGTKSAVYRKHQCMHCQEPCCASVCFVRAFTKTPEGPVLYDPSVCVGCRYCMTACPYHALAYEYDKPFTPRVVRCTMCYPRIKKGLNPGCADACPMGAITFGQRKDLIQVARARIKKHPDRYIDHIYGEHEFGGTSWLTLAGIPVGELGLFENATNEPLPMRSKGFLSIVPLVLTLWPGLLLGFYAFRKRREKLSQLEQQQAVTEALSQAGEETRKKLSDAAAKAKKTQEKAIAKAVKDALAKAEADKEDSK